MPFARKTWNHPNLDLFWLRGSRHRPEWSSAHVLVWSIKPIFCAASVHIHDRTYYINTFSWHGLTADDKKSLEDYLQSLDLTKQQKDQFCGGI